MAKRRPRWLRPVAIFVIFMAVVGALVADLSSVDQAIERQATRAADHYAADAEEQIRDRCLTLLAQDQADCVRQADRAAREDQRVELDLAAQQTTAWWTKIMGIAALIGMGLSAVGVLLVWTTFHETRQANLIARREYGRARVEARNAAVGADIALAAARQNADAAATSATATRRAVRVAQDTAERQLRPYVHVIHVGMTTGHVHMYETYISDSHEVTLHIQNFGQTPAQNVRLRARCFVGGFWNEDFEADLSECAEVPLGDIPLNIVRVRDGYTVLGIEKAYQNIRDGMASIFVEGDIRYTDGFRRDRTTGFRFASSGPDYDKGPPEFTVCPGGNKTE